MRIRPYRDADWPEWLRMSRGLFPDESEESLTSAMRVTRATRDAEVFVIERENAGGALAGFVEVGNRLYAEGCDTSPVGYIEAWFVDADVRRTGLGRALLAAAEDWARGKGYTEMASDALLDNVVSHRAHAAAGYAEVERIVTFRKPLSPS
jgi:aminoglycoside 6'-N-acetyltransferase I